MDPISQQPPMQQSMQPSQPVEQPVQSTQPMHREVIEDHGSNKFMTILFMLLLIAGTGFGGYYLGVKQSIPFLSSVIPTTGPSIAPTEMPIGQQKYAYTLKNYLLDDPKDWNVNRDIQSFNGVISGNKETLSPIDHPDYVITILQGGGDGGVCNYPDNKTADGPQHGDYTDFVQLKDQNGTLYRRGLDGENIQKTGLKYTICQLNQSFYGNLMSFGWITYDTPHNPDKQILSAMDAVVSSIKVE